jgi:phosphoserine phosphatase
MWDIWTSKKIGEVGNQTLVNGLFKSNLDQLNLAYLQKTFATEGSFFVKQTGRLPKAVFFDMDATLITQESLVEMAKYAGTEVEVARVTERAMKGELDFRQALEERLATLSGVSEQVIFDVTQSLTIFEGVKEFIDQCKFLSIPCHVVTGGFEEIAGPLLLPLGFTSIRANRLEVRNGRLTGRTLGPIMDAKGKKARLSEVCHTMGIDPTDAAAIGDGANDIPMLQAAGFKLAFQPKPVLVPYATAVNRTLDHSFWLTTLFQ